ncbi:hypothetical protein COEX109129_27050 [Corallococcus exiguus]
MARAPLSRSVTPASPPGGLAGRTGGKDGPDQNGNRPGASRHRGDLRTTSQVFLPQCTGAGRDAGSSGRAGGAGDTAGAWRDTARAGMRFSTFPVMSRMSRPPLVKKV